MHEVGIMESTLEIALEQATKQKAKRIHEIKMRIGELSGVVPEALEFAFDVVTRGTIAQEAKLNLEIIPVVCYCSSCDLQFTPTDLFYECPRCHQTSTNILKGRELELASLEIS
ncbi:hydrogenase maturation nickel metallochaperone HypA [Pleurocapsales cyanobacterium LEGE 06147]|nr:hydrogenase maturation nickel metallochaperone HypA [Pleurocapsales cyanobacterium LEGE 06147]